MSSKIASEAPLESSPRKSFLPYAVALLATLAVGASLGVCFDRKINATSDEMRVAVTALMQDNNALSAYITCKDLGPRKRGGEEEKCVLPSRTDLQDKIRQALGINP